MKSFVELGHSGSQVYYCESFFGKRTANLILDLIKKMPISKAQEGQCEFDTVIFDHRSILYKNIDLLSLFCDMNKKIFEDIYKVSLKDIKNDWKSVSVKIQKIGEDHEAHSDAGEETIGYNPAGELHPYLSTVTCLTQDYDGGHFEIPEFNISVKLKMGSTIVFPSSGHEHQVTKVTDGERRTLLGFWYI
jgi:hypothetical protein